jgi:hypothetical protein
LPHAASVSGTTTANATIAARRLLTMLVPVLTFWAHILPYKSKPRRPADGVCG